MAEYIIQGETLTSLADEIRVLSGSESAMATSTMVSTVNEANTEVASQEDLIMQITETLGTKAIITDAVQYGVAQSLTPAQKKQARTNIGAAEDTIENHSSEIVNNFPDDVTWQLRSFYKSGRLCIFTVQAFINNTISGDYGFALFTLPYAPVDRVWINNGTQYYMDAGNCDIKYNGSSIAASNIILNGFYMTNG